MRTAAGSLLAVAVATVAASATAAPRSAAAVAQPVEPTSPAAPAPTQVRLALSPAAATYMTELRVRSLLDVELEGSLPIAEEPVGPLDEPSVRVYIDQPEGASVIIQVQAPGRPLTRRAVDVTGLTWDVAARFAAIATAEIVRGELQPVRARRPKARRPTPEELAAADRARPRVRVAAGATSIIAGPGPVRFGPELALGHTTPVVDVDLAGRATFGDGDGRVGSVEAWIGVAHTVHASSWLRFEAGGGLGAGTVSLANRGDDREGGFGHAAARVGVGARLTDETWLAVRFEPGVILGGPARGVDDHPLDGAVLGLGLAIERAIPLEGLRATSKGR